MFTKKTSLVIPTKNRPKLLNKILLQIKDLKIKFHEILIIDSSDKKLKPLIKKISLKYKCKLFNTKSSTSYQRNFGIKNKSINSKFIMFLDDDIVFHRNAFINMNRKINLYEKKNNINILGYGFNQVDRNSPSNIEKIKNSNLIKFLGLYSDLPGTILSSGWQTKIINLKRNTFTDWMHTAALIVPCEKLKANFDINFGEYSYLEDLDFSMQIKNKNKNGKFLLVSSAKFNHPNVIHRTTFSFGILEFVNRYIIVKKYKLSYLNFFYMVSIKTIMSFIVIFKDLNNLNKFLGNLIGIIICLKYLLISKFK